MQKKNEQRKEEEEEEEPVDHWFRSSLANTYPYPYLHNLYDQENLFPSATSKRILFFVYINVLAVLPFQFPSIYISSSH